jgi:cytidine deaminase
MPLMISGAFFCSAYLYMKEKKYEFSYKILNDSKELDEKDTSLLEKARAVTDEAYAPYSKFHVGAAAMLVNGKIVTGTNQENASYPVGICAERSLLATAASNYPGVAIETMAVTYKNRNHPSKSNHPVSPCGMCRQTLQEFESRTNHPIRLILAGMEGDVFIIERSSQLLPLGFSSGELL